MLKLSVMRFKNTHFGLLDVHVIDPLFIFTLSYVAIPNVTYHTNLRCLRFTFTMLFLVYETRLSEPEPDRVQRHRTGRSALNHLCSPLTEVFLSDACVCGWFV